MSAARHCLVLAALLVSSAWADPPPVDNPTQAPSRRAGRASRPLPARDCRDGSIPRPRRSFPYPRSERTRTVVRRSESSRPGCKPTISTKSGASSRPMWFTTPISAGARTDVVVRLHLRGRAVVGGGRRQGARVERRVRCRVSATAACGEGALVGQYQPDLRSRRHAAISSASAISRRSSKRRITPLSRKKMQVQVGLNIHSCLAAAIH